jgi:hypothetical protein
MFQRNQGEREVTGKSGMIFGSEWKSTFTVDTAYFASCLALELKFS